MVCFYLPFLPNFFIIEGVGGGIKIIGSVVWMSPNNAQEQPISIRRSRTPSTAHACAVTGKLARCGVTLLGGP